jgi:outer membrane lipoprotein carrier protein
MFIKISVIYAAWYASAAKGEAAPQNVVMPAPVTLPAPIVATTTPDPETTPDPFASVGTTLTPLPVPVMGGAKGALSAGDVVAKVQSFYAGTKQLTAKFRQTVTNAAFKDLKDPTVSDGKVYIEKPGKMRWDYSEKKQAGKNPAVRKSFLSDGTTLWAVDIANKQVFKRNLADDMLPVAVTFLYGKGDLTRDFDAALDTSGEYGTKDDIVVMLKPKNPSAQYKRLYLVVDPGNFRVRQSIIIDSSDNSNDFRFYDPDLTTDIKDSLFVFDEKAAAAKGYDIKSGDKDTGIKPE